ncbi:MAG: hypothetical protein MUP04_05980 [Anaerolineae bacterium]|nr:hypothetical protein [Anaerolineae bacterium]
MLGEFAIMFTTWDTVMEMGFSQQFASSSSSIGCGATRWWSARALS